MTLMETNNPLLRETDVLEPIAAGVSPPATLADSPPDLVALARQAQMPFYLVSVRGDVIERLDAYAFAKGEDAARWAGTLSLSLGVKVEPRMEDWARQARTKARQIARAQAARAKQAQAMRDREGATTAAVPLVVWPKPVPETRQVIAWDTDNPLHRRVKLLHDILSLRRVRDGLSEAAMIAQFIDPIPGMQKDLIGNRYVCVGNPNPTVLWSCHTDTVHSEDGEQRVVMDDGGFLVLHPDSTGSCLGADCGTGVFLMLEMIRAGVPGLYVFHYGEESGCLGSRWIVRNTPHLLDGIQCAIAFDRMGYTDVITHQIGGRCCSDTFAKSLAAQLPPGYKPDSGGVYTDTAHYTGLVPECTNISVGYFSQHSHKESQSVEHVLELLESLLVIDTDKLTIQRDPKAAIDDDWGDYGGYGLYGGYRGYGGTNRRSIAYDAWEDTFEDETRHPGLHAQAATHDDLPRVTRAPRSLVELLERYPDEAADVLDQWGVEVKSLWDDMVNQYEL